MHKLMLIIVCLFCVSERAHAQQKEYVYQDSSMMQVPIESTTEQLIESVDQNEEDYVPNPTQKNVDTTLYYNAYITPTDSVLAWKNEKSFSYAKNLDSLLRAEKNKNAKKEINYNPPSFNTSWLQRLLNGNVLQLFFWVLAIFFVLFILYKLFFTKGAFRRSAKNEKSNLPLVEEEVIDANTNFDNLIADAIKASNYRLAVRYQYLKSLHTLAQKNIVSLAVDKTNYQYVTEINNESIKKSFASILLNYEYVWYGQFNIEATLYQKLNQQFIQFNQTI
jgi:hypothetical protein